MRDDAGMSGGWRFAATPWRRPEIAAFRDSAPLRAELFGMERLADHARSLARAQQHAPGVRASRALLRRLDANAAALAHCYAQTVASAAAGRPIAPAAEWLIDNYHLVEKQIRKIRDDLPPDYYRQLPVVANGPLAGLPRAFELAWAYVAHSDSLFEAERFRAFVESFQGVTVLTIGELWSLAIMLQLVMVENLRRLAEEGIADEQERQAADALAAEVMAAGDPAEAVQRLAAGAGPVRLVFHAQLALRLRASDPATVEARRWLEQQATAAGTSLAELDRDAQERFVAATGSVRNVIRSMRAVSEIEWGELVEQLSLPDRILSQGSDFAAMDFPSRNLYRNALEELARGSAYAEDAIARMAVALAGRDPSRNRTDRDPGHWLLREGRAELEAASGFVPALGDRLARRLRRGGVGLYIALIALLALLLVTPLWTVAHEAGPPLWMLAGMLAASAVVALETATAIMNRLYASFLPPQLVPALELREGVPAGLRTLVAVPTLIADRAQLEAAIADLEVLHLGAREEQVFYALLSDFPDAPVEEKPGEAELLAHAEAAIDRLNRAHRGPGGMPRFLFLHRRRLWNPAEGVWMGWERKRGKLEELNRLLRGMPGTSYERDGVAPWVPPGVRYVITLDQDTRVPMSAIRRLVGKMAHPVNRPRFDPVLRRVVAGHGVMQPRVTTALPLGRGRSAFERLTGSPAGIDRYAAAASDLYQDLLGEGSFTGKGIYDVDAFMAALAGRVPENAMLSHDLFEGTYARAALVSDVSVIEDVPVRYDAAARRMHRWVRGDWQLLPWILRVARTPAQHLPFAGRAKMLDNLRRSIVAPSAFAALAAGWFLPAGQALPWLAGILLLLLFPPFIPLPSRLLHRSGRNLSWGEHLADVAREALHAAGLAGLQLLTLADQAVRMADAIARTLWRLLVSRRHLLEWMTAAQAARAPAPGTLAMARWMAPSLLLVAALAAAALWQGASPAPVVALAALWLAAPALLTAMSRPRPLHATPRLDARQRQELEAIARDSWSFFARHVTAEHHHLPPDNVQYDPEEKVAARTSPTNIGLYLLAVATAEARGWISRREALDRIGATLATLGRMARHRGHLFNWYDTRTLAVLEPAYVSTVDSGNLAGHLIALANLLEGWEGADAARLAERARAEALAMDFAFLFDPERQLLSIGWLAGESRRDESCYDLLASEARLASLFAIAKGDIPARHWMRLGRSATRVGEASVLISWSGSMFEYLMPSLVLRAPDDSLLEQSNRAMLDLQRRHGRTHGVPWGVSEAGYNARDREMNYQYGPFGVPGLGLKRGLSGDLVIAPYASALAAMVDARAALANLEALEALGARGPHGFYEALDFTPARVPAEARFALVKSHMAHHQGMSVLAIANALDGGRLRAAFHREPMIAAAELFLQERPPQGVGTFDPREEERAREYRDLARTLPTIRSFGAEPSGPPQTHLLAAGDWALMLTDGGAGASHWRGLAINRWRPDPVTPAHGHFLYCQDHTAGIRFGSTRAPLGLGEAREVRVQFGDGRAEFHARHGPISVTTEVLLAADGVGEVRRLTFASRARVAHRIDVTSILELAMAPPAADLAHPAFSRLFIETEAREGSVLVARRRPRSPDEPRIHLAHLAVVEGIEAAPPQWDSDRATVIGRGRSVADPAALDGPLAGRAGTVLDPALALRVSLEVPAGGRARVAFWTLAAEDAETLDGLIDRHRDPSAFERAEVAAWTRAQVERRYLGLDSGERAGFQQLARLLVFGGCGGGLAPDCAMVATHAGPQSGLWAHGISGDLPVMLVRIDDTRDLPVVAEALRCFEFLRGRRLDIDLVILNERSASYVQDLQAAIDTAVAASKGRMGDGGMRGSIFALRADLMTEAQRRALMAAARVDLDARRGRLRRQLEARPAARPAPAGSPDFGLPPPRPPRRARARPVVPPPEALRFWNGHGGFAPDGRAYVIRHGPGRTTPAPWINILANPGFGCHVSADAAGATWAGNARENQLTPWSNDPVGDPPGDVLYLRDRDTGEFWSATAAPCGAPEGRTAIHGFGWSRILQSAHGIETDLLLHVPVDDPVRLARLSVRNPGKTPRRLDVTAYAEWVLGPARARTAPHLVTALDPATGALFARNPFALEGAGRTAFADLGGAQTAWSCDRLAFLGPEGTLARPAALMPDRALRPAAGAGLDPCAVLQAPLDLGPGEAAELMWIIGQGEDEAAARALVERWRAADLDAALAATQAQWDELLGAVQVRTPDPAFDLMLNGWLPYQLVSGRLWGRAGFYQASGAYGFRDQLQDGGALLLAHPQLARPHLLRAAGRQFREGDVQHWWLPESGRGVRTRISDDTSWLALSVADYVAATGDRAVLDEAIPFLEGPPLEPGQHDAFFLPATSAETGTLFEHCARALDRAIALLGDNGLPLIGTGDWNDGMNRVGEHGRGTSVWLAWHVIHAIDRFAPLAEERDPGRAAAWRAASERLRAAVERHAWDGAWYRRATFDDGTWLGSEASEECRIDSIAQSWAVISGAARPERARAAMESVERHLVDREAGLIRLFAPPFDRTPRDPGYIKGYPPGVRENGGQYSHAAMWTIVAMAGLGELDRAVELFALVNPVNHARTPEAAARYRVEPYVVAADVYAVPPHVGRGGWTWYTGAAGWMYRAGLGAILGLRREAGWLVLRPRLPSAWDRVELELALGGRRRVVRVERAPDDTGRLLVSLDGQPVEPRDGELRWRLDEAPARPEAAEPVPA